VFPFRLAKPLKTVLEAQWAVRDGLYVFHRDSKPLGVGAIRSAWKRATKRAGFSGRLVHDLRRTCAMRLRRQGLSESDIQDLCGWETREMFKRYAIKDEKALEAAVGKGFGHVTTT
jgi:integrase